MVSFTVLGKRPISWVFDQDEVWTADGRNVPIDEMDDRYRENVVRWLERQADYLVWAYWGSSLKLWGDPNEMSDGVYSSYMRRLAEGDRAFGDPIEWLHGTKLVKKLKENF